MTRSRRYGNGRAGRSADRSRGHDRPSASLTPSGTSFIAARSGTRLRPTLLADGAQKLYKRQNAFITHPQLRLLERGRDTDSERLRARDRKKRLDLADSPLWRVLRATPERSMDRGCRRRDSTRHGNAPDLLGFSTQRTSLRPTAPLAVRSSVSHTVPRSGTRPAQNPPQGWPVTTPFPWPSDFERAQIALLQSNLRLRPHRDAHTRRDMPRADSFVQVSWQKLSEMASTIGFQLMLKPFMDLAPYPKWLQTRRGRSIRLGNTEYQ